jgi:transcriptional regulator with XRE-family HTH domain
MSEVRVPNQLLIDHRKQRGWSQQDLVNELVALGNRSGERNLGLTFKQVSRWEQGWARPRPPYTKLLCLLFDVPAQNLGLHGSAGPSAHQAPHVAGAATGVARTGMAWTREPAATRRASHQELLELTVVPAVAVEHPRPAWEDVGVEPHTLEFPRLTEVSLLAPDTFDRLEAVLTELDRAYSKECPAELFVLARSFRVRVDQLIQGRHTLKDVRELYVYAGWLSEILAWLSHDLGSPSTAEAYAVDCYRHADQAGHDELCAWAMDALASIALYDKRPRCALTAARKGMARASLPHPLAVRLRAQAARAHARMGQRAQCDELIMEATELYERLPPRGPRRFVVDTGPLATYAVTSYPASASVWLANFEEAKVRADAALKVHNAFPAESRCPSREAIARIDLAIALAELGEADEAVEQGHLALTSPRIVDSVLCRAGDLDAVLAARYPRMPDIQCFQEEYQEVARGLARA